MPNTAAIARPAPAENLRHRRHTLNPDRTFLGQCGIAA